MKRSKIITRDLKKASILKDQQIKQTEKSNLKETDSARKEKYFQTTCHFKEQKGILGN